MNDQDKQALWSLKKKDTGKVYQKIPYTSLKAWILEARIEPDDYLTNPRLGKWIPASEIDELLPFFAPESLGSEVITSEDIAFSWRQESQEDDVAIDLTPMIDVIFLLVIFFAVTTTFAVHEVKNIRIPKSSQTSKYQQEKLCISIDKQRQVFLGREQIALNSLKKVLMRKVTVTGEQDVVLAADHGIDYGFIVSVLDQINGAGIKNVKLKLEKKRE